MVDLLLLTLTVVYFRVYLPSVVLMCFVMPTVVPVYLWGEDVACAYFICSLLRYCAILNATWLVNSAAHLWGARPYDIRINPAENKMVAVLTVGEGFHNYHHTFPQDYTTSEFQYFLNFTSLFIDIFAFFGQAYDRKSMPLKFVDQRRHRTGDLSELARKKEF